MEWENVFKLLTGTVRDVERVCTVCVCSACVCVPEVAEAALAGGQSSQRREDLLQD